MIAQLQIGFLSSGGGFGTSPTPPGMLFALGASLFGGAGGINDAVMNTNVTRLINSAAVTLSFNIQILNDLTTSTSGNTYVVVFARRVR